MSIAHVRSHAGGQLKSASSTFTVSLSADVAATNSLLMGISFDNRASGLGGGPNVSSIDAPGGESATWGLVGREETAVSTGSSSVVTEFWAITTTQTWLSTFTPTITLTVAVGGHAAAIEEFSGLSMTLRGSIATNHSTAGAPSGTVTGPLSGDLVVGASGWESATTPTGDSDTTNGSWSSLVSVGTSGGTDAANVTAAIQYKIVTADGSQTYNPTGANSDAGVVVAVFQPSAGGPPPTEASGVIVRGSKKAMSSRSVIIGGVKKTVTSVSVIVGGVKKPLV